MFELQREATDRLVEFLTRAGKEHEEKMYLIHQPVRPMLAYCKDDWFVALDPYNSRFFIDKDLAFSFPYDFHTDKSLHLKVDEWGKNLLDKARREAVNKWLSGSF